MSSPISTCIANYNQLLNTKYIFIVGRKGETCELSIVFDKYDFFHLAGLHYLTDIRQLHGSREKIYDKIAAGIISSKLIECSAHYPKIKSRIDSLSELATLLESEKLIFRFNNSSSATTSIKHDYLIELKKYDLPRYFFIKELSDSEFHGISLFPADYKDYTIGETRWTLLKASKFVDLYVSPSYIPER